MIGAVAEVLARQRERGRRGLLAGERIDDDPAGRAADQRHVRDVVAAHLVDAVRHLEQAVHAVQLRLPPQARVHARRARRPSTNAKSPGGPDHASVGGPDHEIRLARDEAALRVLEVLRVGERERARDLRVRFRRAGGRGREAVLVGVDGDRPRRGRPWSLAGGEERECQQEGGARCAHPRTSGGRFARSYPIGRSMNRKRTRPASALPVSVSTAPARAALMSFCASHSSPWVPRYAVPSSGAARRAAQDSVSS